MITIFHLILALSISSAQAVSTDAQVSVPAGLYQPLFRDKGEEQIKIVPLEVDATPVTNEKFLAFVKENPRWKKGRVTSLFADKTYLEQWPGPETFPVGTARHPVVQVSWFAARAYCHARASRLPTMAEWEYFSQTQDPAYEKETLKWYSQAQAPRRAVGGATPNKFGLYDTSNLIWEWVDDFSGAIMPGDSREGPMRDMFCGGAALGSKDPRQYAAFMRYAFRSSLKAQYTTSSLGFRCVKDGAKGEK